MLTQHLEESRTKLLEEVSEHKKSREELRHQLRETAREAVSGWWCEWVGEAVSGQWCECQGGCEWAVV